LRRFCPEATYHSNQKTHFHSIDTINATLTELGKLRLIENANLFDETNNGQKCFRGQSRFACSTKKPA
ncbi:hypothetical protein, partial [Vibrio lentus]|uniref:hypothetical protein n=1 Tax=Vibrio lentus TaxID=136468 RepID=UPI001A7E1040